MARERKQTRREMEKWLWKIIYKLLTSSLYRIHYHWCAFPSTQIIFDLEICVRTAVHLQHPISATISTSIRPCIFDKRYTLYNILITKYVNYIMCSLASFFIPKRSGDFLFLSTELQYNVAFVIMTVLFCPGFCSANGWHAQPFNTWMNWTNSVTGSLDL